MPKLHLKKLKTPCYGNWLGLWDDEDDRRVEKVAQGDYFQAKPMKGH